jgi:hypothetical protein
MYVGAFQWNFRGAGFTRHLPNPATPFYSPNQLIHLIHKLRHPKLLIKVPAAVFTDDHLIAYTQYYSIEMHASVVANHGKRYS